MATIDVLKLVFDSDASGMKRGTQEAKKGADDLKKSVLETDKAAQDMGDSFLSMVSDAKGSIASLVGFSTVTAGILNEAARVDQLGKFADTIGQNIEEIDAWGQVVARNGGTAEGFQGTLKGLTDSLTELQLTGAGPAADVLARFGISARDAGGGLKSAFDLLPEIADSFEGLSKAESLKFGQQLGLDQGTILTLQQGRFEVDQMVRRQKELGVATEEDAEIAREFNTAWKDTRQVFSSVFREVGASVLPVLADMLGGVQNFIQILRDNDGFVEGIFLGLGTLLTAKLAPAFIATLTNPITLLAALAIAFAAVYDDIKNFLDGNDSLIGQISEKYPVVGKVVTNLARDIKALFTTIKEFDFSEFINNVINSVLADFEKFKQEIEELKDLLGFGDDERPSLIQSVGGGHSQSDIPEALRSAANNPLTSSAPNTLNNSSRTVNQNSTLNVGGINVSSPNANPKEVAREVSNEMNNQYRNTNSQYDDGILA